MHQCQIDAGPESPHEGEVSAVRLELSDAPVGIAAFKIVTTVLVCKRHSGHLRFLTSASQLHVN